MLSPKTKRNISRIIPFGLIWLIFSLVYTLLERGLLNELTYYPSTGNPYTFSQNIFITPISALIAGLLIGTIEILYLNRLFIKKKFTEKIVYKTVIYLGIITLFLLSVTAVANAIELQTTIFNEEVWKNV